MKLTNVQTEYVKCRAWGHQWDSFAPLQSRRGYGVCISLRCERCGMERYDWIDRGTGELNSRQYDRPKDYQFAKEDRPTIGDLRQEALRRLSQRRK